VLGGPTAALKYVGTWGGRDSRFACHSSRVKIFPVLYWQNKHDNKETYSSRLLTSCKTSMNDLAALFSKAFPCLVLHFIILDCFFAWELYRKAENKRWLTSLNYSYQWVQHWMDINRSTTHRLYKYVTQMQNLKKLWTQSLQFTSCSMWSLKIYKLLTLGEFQMLITWVDKLQYVNLKDI